MVENRGRYIIDFTDIPAGRHEMPELEVEKRINNFDEVELGLSEEDARNEARRCLSCRRCLGCELCWAACEPRAIVFDQEADVINLTVDEIIIPDDVGLEIGLKKGEYGFGLYKNVIDAFQFEAMLDEDGPYGGMVLRPYDGDIPARIAFVVNLSGGSDDQLFSYIANEAAEAKRKVSDLAISIFSTALPAGASCEGVTLRNCAVQDVKENAQTKCLIVTVNEKGNAIEEECDILIVARAPSVTHDIRNLRKKIA